MPTRQSLALLGALLFGACGTPATTAGTSPAGAASTSGTTGSGSTSASTGSSGATTEGPGSSSGASTGTSSGASSSSSTSSASSASSSSSSGSTGSSGTSGGPWVMGYYVGYERDLYPSAELDFAAVSHLMVGRGVPRADGSVDMSLDIDSVSGPALAHDLVSRAHAAGRKALLMLGGAGEQAGWQGAASSAHRAAFVANLLQLLTDYGFDGFDLDWEPVDAADQPLLSALVADLRAQAPAGLLLTMPVGWINPNYQTVEPFYAQLAPQLDRLSVMSYGMAGAWQGWDVWHSSALFGGTPSTPSSVDSSIQAYLAAGIPAAKLGVGAGFYGSCWQGATAIGQSTSSASLVDDDGHMSYANIMAAYYDPSAYHYDPVARAPWLGFSSTHSPAGLPACDLVSYEDPTSLADKAAYVQANGLGGVIIWTINQGHLPSAPAGQRDPNLEALRAVLHP